MINKAKPLYHKHGKIAGLNICGFSVSLMKVSQKLLQYFGQKYLLFSIKRGIYALSGAY